MSVSAKCKNQRLTKGKVAPIAVVKTSKKVGCFALARAQTLQPHVLHQSDSHACSCDRVMV